jgi:DNA-binding NarL/FixJ family response regulator
VVLNIKLVGGDPQLAQLLREAGVHCSVVSREAVASLAQAGAQQPDMLVLDLRDQTAFPAAVSVLKRNHPSTAVLLVVSQLDPALMLEAMRAGVNECVTHPVSPRPPGATCLRSSGPRVAWAPQRLR